MTQTQNPAAVALVLRHTFDAPREAVFKAWTDPAIMQQFLGPGNHRCKDVQVDLREGGTYRITMVAKDGEEIIVVGTYSEVVVPERIVCTWRWLEDLPEDEYDTLLTLDFIAKGMQTELVLLHENFKTAESRDNHAEGWTAILEASAKLIAS